MKFRGLDKDKNKIRANVDLTPLIDVVFLLLIFFMLSTTFVVQSSIQIEMPEADGSTELEQKDLSITLAYGTDGPDGGGKIYVNKDEVASMNELSERLAAELEQRPEVFVLIRPDARVETRRLVRVLGIASSVGIERYGIAAQPLTEEE
ncbi:MAG: biopolymer transporter ExbD [Candidatus Hydrogenedentes bacterium]|nr:biopolymer transporter ExbD [Candidatus Hydrogenedentota bacterium]